MKNLVIFCLLMHAAQAGAQQFALFNTKTMYDAFENPASSHFNVDRSRQFSSNFLLPYVGINAANQGKSDLFVRRLINEQLYRIADLEIGTGEKNNAFMTTNAYVLGLKIFRSYKYNQEIGLSWQVRSDLQATYTNETIAIFDSFKKFADRAYSGIFNSSGFQQSYHQFSLSYREDINKKLSAGVKLSLLSGIIYNKLNISDSYMNLDTQADRLEISFNGIYKSSFFDPQELSKSDAYPLFKHPGASISAGFKYYARGGYTVMGNIKDLGVIRWSKDSYFASIQSNEVFTGLGNPGASNQVSTRLREVVEDSDTQGRIYSLTNAKADVYVSRTLGNYIPSFIVSKNLFYKGGDIALVNTYNLNRFAVSLTPAYNFNKVLMVGLQGMYRTDNFEAFLGSDNIGKTVGTTSGLLSRDVTDGSGYNGASIYIGVGIKFGKIVQHPLNSDVIPGIEEDSSGDGFWRNLFRRN